jgi:hypothetical protein
MSFVRFYVTGDDADSLAAFVFSGEAMTGKLRTYQESSPFIYPPESMNEHLVKEHNGFSTIGLRTFDQHPSRARGVAHGSLQGRLSRAGLLYPAST